MGHSRITLDQIGAFECEHTLFQINAANFELPEKESDAPGDMRGIHRNILAGKSLTQEIALACVVEIACFLHSPHLAIRRILPGTDSLWVSPGTGFVSLAWSIQAKGVVGALVVVKAAIAIELALGIELVGNGSVIQQFLCHGAIKTLLFSLRLRVMDPSMECQYSKLHQPNFKPRKPCTLDGSPRVSVITQQGKWYAVFLKDPYHDRFDFLKSFGELGLAAQVEPAVIVNNVQRMASLPVRHGKMPFVIRLPHLVWCFLLKPLMRGCGQASLLRN